jgi:hypothetical protein
MLDEDEDGAEDDDLVVVGAVAVEGVSAREGVLRAMVVDVL